MSKFTGTEAELSIDQSLQALEIYFILGKFLYTTDYIVD